MMTMVTMGGTMFMPETFKSSYSLGCSIRFLHSFVENLFFSIHFKHTFFVVAVQEVGSNWKYGHYNKNSHDYYYCRICTCVSYCILSYTWIIKSIFYCSVRESISILIYTQIWVLSIVCWICWSSICSFISSTSSIDSRISCLIAGAKRTVI